MTGEKLLSDTQCKNAKPKAKVYYLNDGAGLRLRCRTDGSRTWVFRYRVNAKEQTLGLGSYPVTTIAIARAKADENRNLIIAGKNPIAEKRANKVKRAISANQTFGAVAREWITHNKEHWSTKHLNRNESLIRLYLLPELGRLPISEIEESYLFTALKPVYDRGRKESARRSRGIAAQIFAYGKDTHRCQRNPARDMVDSSYFRKPQVQHLKAISQPDVPSLISELQKVGGEQRLNPQTVCALLLALYTGHRDHAIRGAKWGEIDFANRDFIVPGERMKNRHAHKVPLPEQAIEALKQLKSVTFNGFDSFVFTSNAKMGYMSENTLRKALHRIGYEVTVHGFRSLITDVLNENGFNPDAIERQLNHQEKNAVRGAYLRSEFENLRRPMMQWFADWCEGKAEGGVINNVVSMQGRR